MFGEPDESGAFTPDFNAYLGVSKKGRDKLKDMQELGVSTDQIPGVPPFSIKENGISVMSGPSDPNGKLVLPEGAEDFGKSGISFFLSLDELEPEVVAEMVDEEAIEIVLRVAKFIYFQFDSEGGKIVITAKDGQENVLKQALTEVMKDISGNMGNNFTF